MKERELRNCAHCAMCRKPFGHTGLPIFYRVRIARWGVDATAVQRQDGLAAMLGGNSLLAQVMGPDEDVAKLIGGPVEITICHGCAEKPFPVMALPELDDVEDD